ncbi:lipopolysaccharide biosynthesis protein [Vibrio crassostreae]|uniref:lipopolysaccharide biosynthesis protein n=1 Tax=Vibrio crassostreae TaxID=246167 RepID=UPI00352F8EA8
MSFFKDTLWFAISKASMGLANFIIITLVMVLYGDKVYSDYSTTIAYVFMIVPFSVGWVNQSYIRIYQQRKEEKSVIFGSALNVNILTLLILSFISFYGFSLDRYLNLITYLLFVMLYGINLFFIVHLQASMQAQKVALVEITRSVSLLLSFVCLIYVYESPFLPWVLSFSITSVLFIYFLSKDDIKLKFYFNLGHIRFFFKYGSGISLWFGAFLIIPVIDRELLSYRLDSEVSGLYFIMLDFCNRIYGLLISPVVMALLSHGFKLKNDGVKIEDIDSFIISKLKLISLFGIPLSFLAAAACYLYTFVYLGKEIKDVSEILLVIVYSFVGYFWQVSMICQKFLEFRSKVYLMAFFMVISVLSIYFIESFMIEKTNFYMYFGVVQILMAIIYSLSCYFFRNRL